VEQFEGPYILSGILLKLQGSTFTNTAMRGPANAPGPRRGMPAGVALFLSAWRQPCFAGFVSRSGRRSS
jgi:hypothetical protein